VDNPPRVLTEGLGLRLHRGSWPVPAIFRLIQEVGQVAEAEMAHVFNMGLGMLAIVPADQAEAALRTLGDGAWQVGEVVVAEGSPRVVFS
jgi:phosphoribosylformylglycinamidine cyclo-ligase